MEDLNKYMEKTQDNDKQQITNLSDIRGMVQELNDKKNDYLQKEPLVLLKAVDLEDNKKMTDCYREVVLRNEEAIDLIINIKDSIFKIKLVKDKLDKNTTQGMQQAKQMDYFINLLNDILSIISDERSKLDRVVRYYEKTFSYYKDF